MGNLSFDFNKIKRTFFDVTLKDGRKLVVKMPMKKTFENIQYLEQVSRSKDEAIDLIEKLGSICAEAISNNMSGEEVAKKYFVENYDIEEMKMFIQAYYKFVATVKNDPN